MEATETKNYATACPTACELAEYHGKMNRLKQSGLKEKKKKKMENITMAVIPLNYWIVHL